MLKYDNFEIKISNIFINKMRYELRLKNFNKMKIDDILENILYEKAFLNIRS